MHRILKMAVLAGLALWGIQHASAASEPFQAGVVRVPVAADPALDTLIWYPTAEAGEPWRIGPFPMAASHDAPVADGPFPVVLLSHGGGRSGGTPLLLRGLPARLARNGFVVIAPFHGKTRFPGRPAQIKAALGAVTADPRFKPHVAPDALAMIGYSLGGAVTLTLAGATPDFAALARYCEEHPEDGMSCGGGPQSSGSGEQPAASGPPTFPTLPLKALVLLDPFAVLFSPESLAAIDLPVLLVRPEASALGAANILTLQETLPREPRIEYVPGGHFVLADVCPAVLRAEAAAVCEDAPGVDRGAIHREMDQVILEFLTSNL